MPAALLPLRARLSATLKAHSALVAGDGNARLTITELTGVLRLSQA